MNVLRIFAPLALFLPFAWAQCSTMSCRVDCNSYYELCIETDGCTWDDGDSYCESSDGENSASCCLDATTTPAPTRPPTCASASSSTEDDPCYGLEEDCCTTRYNSLYCEYSTSELCTAEGGPSCCEMIGSDTTTTEWEADSTTTTEWEADTTTTTVLTTTSPTASPTTPAPSHPGELTCGDEVSGDYSGEIVRLQVRMPYDGSMTIDASGSDFEIESISVFDNDDNELTVVDVDGCVEGVLTIYDLVYNGDYTFQVLGADGVDEGEFDIVVSCTSGSPTASPSKEPTSEPSSEPSVSPSDEPTASPSAEPSSEPTESPSAEPTDEPTESPSADPTDAPSAEPTDSPTEEPTDEPTQIPTEEPTESPSEVPTAEPTDEPTTDPSAEPTTSPSDEPSTSPTPQPTAIPTTAAPSHPGELTCGDQVSGDYSGKYVEIEVRMPYDGALIIDASGSDFEIESILAFDDEGNELMGDDADESAGILTIYDLVYNGDYIFQVMGADGITSGEFDIAVSCSSDSPTSSPSKEPTSEPTDEPSVSPSDEPTVSPSAEPSAEPTEAPTAEPTDEPTEAPTDEPTSEPTDAPSDEPTDEPTEAPTDEPTSIPTEEPTASPSSEPTESPTEVPTDEPSTSPTPQPTALPTTAAPSHPGELICGDEESGDYSGEYVAIEVRMPHDGAMTIDASGSDFEIGSITAFDGDGNELAGDADESAGILTLYDLVHEGDYTFHVMGADDVSEGEFDIVVSCTSDSPTASPSTNPSAEPTEAPSAEPSSEPTASPSTDPSAEPTEAPSAEPTDEPTEAPTDAPTTASPTTATPTTASPTTASPTTSSPTTSSPTTSEPTTSSPTTASPTTSSPTTSSPTTASPTTASPTTPSPTTPYPTTDIPTVAEDTTTTEYNPTPRPTMKSALKWDMIHPQYKGSDGELLWHVYYGDFSDDERFDGFRKNELWDADVIRPILQMDIKFDRFSMASASKGQNKQLSRSAGTPAMSSVSSAAQHSSYGVWLVLAAVVLVLGAFAYWLKFKSGDSKLFNQLLNNLEAKTLITRNTEDECYVY